MTAVLLSRMSIIFLREKRLFLSDYGENISPAKERCQLMPMADKKAAY
jgi:hypothetical protein